MLNLNGKDEYMYKKVSMIKKYHNHTLQAKPQHRVGEPHNTKSHTTSMEMHKQFMDLTRPDNTIKQQPSALNL